MNGQWFGEFTGSSIGTIVVNIDELADSYQGVAYLLPTDQALPGTAAWFKTPNKDGAFSVRTSLLLPLDPSSALPARSERVNDFETPTVCIY